MKKKINKEEQVKTTTVKDRGRIQEIKKENFNRYETAHIDFQNQIDSLVRSVNPNLVESVESAIRDKDVKDGIFFISQIDTIKTPVNPIGFTVPLACESLLNIGGSADIYSQIDIEGAIKEHSATTVSNIITNFLFNMVDAVFVTFCGKLDVYKTAIFEDLTDGCLRYSNIYPFVARKITFPERIVNRIMHEYMLKRDEEATIRDCIPYQSDDIDNFLTDVQNRDLGTIGIVCGGMMNELAHRFADILLVNGCDFSFMKDDYMVGILYRDNQLKEYSRNAFVGFLLDLFSSMHRTLMYLVHSELYRLMEFYIPMIALSCKRIEDKGDRMEGFY